jgi:hypothetical protein
LIDDVTWASYSTFQEPALEVWPGEAAFGGSRKIAKTFDDLILRDQAPE